MKLIYSLRPFVAFSFLVLGSSGSTASAPCEKSDPIVISVRRVVDASAASPLRLDSLIADDLGSCAEVLFSRVVVETQVVRSGPTLRLLVGGRDTMLPQNLKAGLNESVLWVNGPRQKATLSDLSLVLQGQVFVNRLTLHRN